MEKNMKKRPHDFLWRGSQMESKLMPGKEVTQQRTHNTFYVKLCITALMKSSE